MRLARRRRLPRIALVAALRREKGSEKSAEGGSEEFGHGQGLKTGIPRCLQIPVLVENTFPNFLQCSVQSDAHVDKE